MPPTSKKPRRAHTKSESRRRHKEIMAAVEELPALLAQEMKERQPEPKKELTRAAIHRLPRLDPKAEKIKTRILIGSVTFLGSIVFAVWFLTATSLIDRWRVAPTNSLSVFQESKKQFTDIINKATNNDTTDVERAMKTAFEQMKAQQAAEAAVASELQTLFVSAAATGTATATTSTALATSSEDMVGSGGNVQE